MINTFYGIDERSVPVSNYASTWVKYVLEFQTRTIQQRSWSSVSEWRGNHLHTRAFRAAASGTGIILERLTRLRITHGDRNVLLHSRRWLQSGRMCFSHAFQESCKFRFHFHSQTLNFKNKWKPLIQTIRTNIFVFMPTFLLPKVCSLAVKFVLIQDLRRKYIKWSEVNILF